MSKRQSFGGSETLLAQHLVCSIVPALWLRLLPDDTFDGRDACRFWRLASAACLLRSSFHCFLFLPAYRAVCKIAFESLEKFLTREYYEAMDIASDMVVRETPIPINLRGVHNDPVEAAVRISRFWKYRKIFFGEQWLLPMTMNGFGALDELDCEAVKSGVVFIGPLITVDWTKAFEVTNTALSQGIDPIGSGERLLMYLMVANMEGLSRGPSILFHPILSKRRPAMEIHKRFWECFETACPSTLGEIVVTHAHQEEGQRELLDFLRYQTVSVVKMATSKVPKQIYSNSSYNTLALLQKNGVDRDIVPASIGGNLDNDTSFSRWTEMRLCIESFLALPPRTLQMP